jgi:hypothetical protein
MSEAVLIALIVSIGPTFGIVVQIILSSIRDRLTQSKIAEVHVLVNNRQAKMDARQIEMMGQIAALKAEIARLRET